MIQINTDNERMAVTLMPSSTQSPDTYAWKRLNQYLFEHPAIAGIGRILAGVELGRPAGLLDLELKDALRLVAVAKVAVHSLNPEMVEQAVDEAAHAICDAEHGEYRPFEEQPAAVQAHYRRVGQTAYNAMRAALEGLTEAQEGRL